MKAFIIVEHGVMGYMKLPLFNLKRESLAFPSEEHAQLFIDTHRDKLKPIVEIRDSELAVDSLYKPWNKWERLESEV